MTGDFNIKDSNWDPNFQYHSTHTETHYKAFKRVVELRLYHRSQ